jgi:hypothetical protein
MEKPKSRAGMLAGAMGMGFALYHQPENPAAATQHETVPIADTHEVAKGRPSWSRYTEDEAETAPANNAERDREEQAREILQERLGEIVIRASDLLKVSGNSDPAARHEYGSIYVAVSDEAEWKKELAKYALPEEEQQKIIETLQDERVSAYHDALQGMNIAFDEHQAMWATIPQFNYQVEWAVVPDTERHAARLISLKDGEEQGYALRSADADSMSDDSLQEFMRAQIRDSIQSAVMDQLLQEELGEDGRIADLVGELQAQEE